MRTIKNFLFFLILILPLTFVAPVTVPKIEAANSVKSQRAALQKYLDSGTDINAEVQRIVSGNQSIKNPVLFEESDDTVTNNDEPDIITHHNLDGSMYETEEYGWVSPEPLFTPAAMLDKTLVAGTAASGSNPDAGRIVIGIAGDGYQNTTTDKNAFLSIATQVAAHFTGFYPFNMFKDYINVYAIEVHSTDSGITDESVTPNIIKNTYFNARWTINSNNAWGLRMEYTRMTTVRNSALGTGSISGIVIVNSDRPAIGGSYSNGSASGANCVVGRASVSAAGNTTIHELGHAVGNLGDEYNILSGQSERVNRTHQNNATTALVKWRAFLGAESPTSSTAWDTTVQILRFTETVGHHSQPWFRSTASCNMNQSGGRAFCMVCNVELVRVLASKTGFGTHYFAAAAWDTSTTSRSIPAGATRVLDYAFAANSAMTSVTLPSSVLTVGYMAFLNCSALNRININATVPPIFSGRNGINGAFMDVTKTSAQVRQNIDLFVPTGTRAAYQAAWPGFRSYNDGGAVPTVTSVTVTPGTATVSTGGTHNFTATVQGTGNPSQSVTWSVTGGISGTSISTSGKLSVASAETAATLNVRATSAENPAVSGTAVVTVSAPPTYGISLSQSGTYTFTTSAFGYSAAALAHTVTVTNTGNQPTGTLSVTLTGTSSSSFQILGNNVNAGIGVSGNSTFQVAPVSGLSVGSYSSVTVTVSGGNGITARTFTVSFTVNRANAGNVGHSATVAYAGSTFDLDTISGLFTIPGNGARTYSIRSGGTGAASVGGGSNNRILTVTRGGTVIIGLTTAQGTNHNASGSTPAEATLTVNRAAVINTAYTISIASTTSVALGSSGLFSFGANAGARTYSIESGTTGTGSVNNANGTLAVTTAGIFKIGLVTTQTDLYAESSKAIATLTVEPPIKTLPDAPTVINPTYSPFLILQHVTLPSGWVWETPSASLTAGSHTFKAIHAETALYYRTETNVQFAVLKANPTAPSIQSAVFFTGMTLADINYLLPSGWSWESPAALLSIGDQSFKAMFAGNQNYNAAESMVQFIVTSTKVDPSIPTVADVIYSPTLTLASVTLPNEWVWETPALSLTAGYKSYNAIHAETQNHNYLVATINFTVLRADPPAPVIAKVTLSDNIKFLNDIKLPDGWQWEDPSAELTAGFKTYNAIFDGDTNYNPVTIEVLFTVEIANTITPGSDDDQKPGGLKPATQMVILGTVAFLITAVIFITLFSKSKYANQKTGYTKRLEKGELIKVEDYNKPLARAATKPKSQKPKTPPKKLTQTKKARGMHTIKK